jgi:phage tail-like protein
MDVNGTRLHTLLGRRDFAPLVAASRAPEDRQDRLERWLRDRGVSAADIAGAASAFRPLAWDDAKSMLRLERMLPRLKPPGGQARLRAEERRGACADAFGNLFWIAGDRARVRLRPAGLDTAGDYWSVAALEAAETPSAGAFRRESAPAAAPAPLLSGLAVTTAHYLVAGTLAPAGLLTFDLHGSGAPCWWRWPEALGFAPHDIAPTADGGVLILDRPAAGAARLWRLDRNFGGGERHIELDAANAVALLELPDASVLILDAGAPGAPAAVQRWRGARRTGVQVLDTLADAHDFAALVDADAAPGTTGGRLLIATAEAAQAFALRFTADGDALSLELEPVALPLQRFAGKALAACGTRVFYDSAQRDPAGERWVALAEQPRYRYFPEAKVEAVVAEAPQDDVLVFDGKQPGCVWHRVMLDACIPGGCEVRIESRAADERGQLDEAGWDAEPAPYRRAEGSELPFHRPFGSAAADPHLGTFETLLQAATGRYLALRLTLRGDGRASPQLRSLRVYYPRFSYLREYLPAAYREEAETAGFLERYLANVEGLFTSVEGRIERTEALLDPAVAPAEYLPWLSGWLGAMLEESWEEARRRLFLRFAWLLFRWRGTPPGLQAWLRLATDPCPDESIFAPLLQAGAAAAPGYGAGRLRIVESFELRRFPALLPGEPAAPALREPRAPWQPAEGGGALHERFREFLRARHGEAAEADSATVRFSPVLPSDGARADDWLAFVREAFAFEYAPVRAEDAARYREFLARRYGHVAALNQAYGRLGAERWSGFAAVALPAESELPADGAPLADWIEFVSLALPIARGAHRFYVLVPATPAESGEQREARAARVRTLVEREKPAHTDFEVKLFWALFRVGAARLGIDSVLGEGGRFVAMVLDAGYLGEGYLAEGHPWSASGRRVVGRDRIQG